MLALIQENWPWFSLVAYAALAAVASGHAILTKNDSQSAIGWTVICWVFPLAGPVFYYLLGINRVARKGAEIRQRKPGRARRSARMDSRLRHLWPEAPDAMVSLAQIGNRVADRPLVGGNRILAHHGQLASVEAMIEAVQRARRSVVLCTYIFDRDPVGLRMAGALVRARERGVAIRVLIDGIGALYSMPTILPVLRKGRVPVARYLWSLVPWKIPYLNLRNHRKLLIVDGRVGFTGGVNLRARKSAKIGLEDTHFRVEGPVLEHLFEVFQEDWQFTTGELLDDPVWTIEGRAAGRAIARGISDGPDSRDRRLHTMVLGALTQATRQVRICTPYFLPDQVLISAIRVATLRGIRIDVVLPRTSNLPWVAYAMMGQMPQIVAAGARVHLCPEPFDHSKLMTVDDTWSMIGSANWDTRSLRLNFEFNIECYDTELAASLNAYMDERIRGVTPLTTAELQARPAPVKLLQGVARLLTPYL